MQIDIIVNAKIEFLKQSNDSLETGINGGWVSFFWDRHKLIYDAILLITTKVESSNLMVAIIFFQRKQSKNFKNF